MHKVGPITEAEASKLAPKFVQGVKKNGYQYAQFDSKEYDKSNAAKRNQLGLIHYHSYDKKDAIKTGFYIVRVTSNKMNAIGEQDFRISNGDYSWRISPSEIIML